MHRRILRAASLACALALAAELSAQVELFDITGTVANNELGTAVAGAGDFNGDGFADVVAGAPGNVGGAVPRVFVFSGADGSPLATWLGVMKPSFGAAAAPAGDPDLDGLSDVVIGSPFAPFISTPTSSFGLVEVYPAAGGGPILSVPGGSNSALGFAVAFAGDLNGDGVDDFAAGAPGYFSGLGTVPSVAVYSGIDASVLLVATGPVDSGFGAALAAGRDVDGDQVPDLLVGAPSLATTAVAAGGAFLISGAGGAILQTLSLPGLSGGAALGTSVAFVDDQDGDQVPDLIAGAPFHDTGTFSGAIDVGRVGVFSGATGAVIHDVVGLPNLAPTQGGPARVGRSVAGLGDVDADGVPDFAVGAPWVSGPTPSSGRVYVRSGADGALIWTLPAESFGEWMGHAVANAGDVNGDGRAELVAAAPRFGGSGFLGAVRIVSCGFALDIGQPAGPGSIRLTNACGRAGDLYVTALTFDPANAGAGFGTGWWSGLHIPVGELFAQILAGAPPFVGILDASGGSVFALPAGSLPPPLAGATLYGVSTSFVPPFGVQTAASLPDARTLL